jgi:hypothetical protein
MEREMKSDLAEQLKEILDNMSQEEFDREWSKITALELGVEGIGSESEEKNIPKSLDSSPEGCTFDVQ